MTKILIGKRCSGKTTRLIEQSAREWIYILTSTPHRAHAIFDTARDMGLDIPYPVTLREYLHGNRFHGSSIRRDGLLIDDVDDVLRLLFDGVPIHAITLTDYGNIERLQSFVTDEEESNDEIKRFVGKDII